jgi:hypothetical protein
VDGLHDRICLHVTIDAAGDHDGKFSLKRHKRFGVELLSIKKFKGFGDVAGALCDHIAPAIVGAVAGF